MNYRHFASHRVGPQARSTMDVTTIDPSAGRTGPTWNGQRETRMWWSVTDSAVLEVRGYSCAPLNPDTWWCPAVGYSLSTKHHLFETEKEAVQKLIADLTNGIEVAKDNITALKLRLENLK